jgi:hypothetical protein
MLLVIEPWLSVASSNAAWTQARRLRVFRDQSPCPLDRQTGGLRNRAKRYDGLDGLARGAHCGLELASGGFALASGALDAPELRVPIVRFHVYLVDAVGRTRKSQRAN